MNSQSLSARIWKSRVVYLFIAPYFLLFAVFQLFPLVWSFVLSLHKWSGLGAMEFVGLANYRQLITDDIFLLTLTNTAYYWAVNIIVIIPVALVLASIIHSPWLRRRDIFQTVAFVPYVTASVAAGLIFYILFDFEAGLINDMLELIGVARQPWLLSTSTSKIPVVSLTIWRLTPWYMLILYSGLKSIDPELYESAVLDGANPLQKLWYITIPMISAILFFCFITLSIDSFRIFAEPHVLTRGGPANSSMSIVQYLYMNGFRIFKIGYAATVGYALACILLVVSGAQLYSMIRRNREIAQ